MGVLGKSGIAIMVGTPVIGSALNAIQETEWGKGSDAELTGFSKMIYGFGVFMNGLSKGFSLNPVFGKMKLMTVGGSISHIGTDAENVLKGGWWSSTILGGSMVAVDRLIAMAVKAAVKSPIGGFYLTGR